MKQSMKFIFGLAVLLISFQASAQVKLNPKFGVNASALDTKIQDIRAEARVGWNAGLDLRIGEGFLFFQPGAHYYAFTADLVKDVDINDGLDISEQTSIRSVKLPINIGMNLTGDGGLLGLQAIGGISPTFVTSVNEKSSIDFTKDDLTSLTWGANVGLGLDVLFMTVNANYEIGLTDFFADATGRNNVFTLSLGVKF